MGIDPGVSHLGGEIVSHYTTNAQQKTKSTVLNIQLLILGCRIFDLVRFGRVIMNLSKIFQSITKNVNKIGYYCNIDDHLTGTLPMDKIIGGLDKSQKNTRHCLIFVFFDTLAPSNDKQASVVNRQQHCYDVLLKNFLKILFY